MSKSQVGIFEFKPILTTTEFCFQKELNLLQCDWNTPNLGFKFSRKNGTLFFFASLRFFPLVSFLFLFFGTILLVNLSERQTQNQNYRKSSIFSAREGTINIYRDLQEKFSKQNSLKGLFNRKMQLSKSYISEKKKRICAVWRESRNQSK